LWHTNHKAFKVLLKEKTMTKQQAESLVKKAFAAVAHSENKHIMVKGDASPFNGDTVYWSKRESKHYDGLTAKVLIKQDHKCGYCGLRFVDGEDIHLHHIDGNHNNWKPKNLTVVHQSCHQYIHTSKRET
jgi:5-methylcytosine-specific restriction endonuclease McrA